MAAAAAVPGNRGSRGGVLALKKEGGEGEDGSESAEMVQASQGDGEGVTRSAGAIRRRRGASTAVLDVRARDGAAWRGRAGWGGRFGRTRCRGGGLAGRVARGRRPRARPALDRGGRESREKREREIEV